jgi:hypothetical protein
MQLSFGAYTIGTFAFFGSFLMVFFFGTGLVSIPLDFILNWLDKPKPMNESQFKKEKDSLVKQIEYILEQGRDLYENRLKIDVDKEEGKIGRFAYMRESRKSTTEQHEFEANCILIEREFENLQATAQYKHKVEPLKYTCSFILGLLTIVLFFIIFVQMWTAGTLRYDDKQKNPWLSTELDNLSRSPNWSFVAVLCFCFFGYYFFLASLVGNIKFGLRFFSLSFYPMVPKETFVNSFIVNALVMNIWMVALTYQSIDLFRQFFTGTQAAILFQVITKNQMFYGWAFRRQVFNTATIVWVFIAIIYFALKPREKINDNMVKRKDLESKK